MAEDGSKIKSTDTTSGVPIVFISYASPNSAIAQAVCEALERAGVPCWIAPRNVRPGTFYADEIVGALDATKAIVLILSQDAANSPHVIREVERATSKRRTLITLRIDQALLPPGLEYFLNTTQWLDASTGDAFSSLPELVAAVRFAIESPTTPTTVVSQTSAARTLTLPVPAPSGRTRSRRSVALVAGVAGALIIGGLVSYRLWRPSPRITAPPTPGAVAAAHAAKRTELATPEKSVAVLPFVDMSEKKDQEYFSDGLSEELIDMLTKVPDLKVPARTSSFFFKGKQITIADIAKMLSVTHVLEGSVRKSGNALRITAQLIRVEDGYHMWSVTYDRKLDDIFKIQDEIATAVVEALRVSLLNPEPAHSQTTTSNAYELGGTDNPDAYDEYLLGLHVGNQGSPDDHRRAITIFAKAIQYDPSFADAYAAMAIEESNLAGFTADVTGFQRAQFDAEKSLALQPGLVRGYRARAYARSNLLDFAGYRADTKRAYELAPQDSKVQMDYAVMLATFSRASEAVLMLKKAIQLDPLNQGAWGDLGSLLSYLNDLPNARRAIDQCLAISPREANCATIAGQIDLIEGRYDDALQKYKNTGVAGDEWFGAALVEYSRGKDQASQQALATLIKEHAADSAYQVAEAYAWRGERDNAFDWLQRAYRQRDNGLNFITFDPLMANFKGDPRFGLFIKKLGITD